MFCNVGAVNEDEDGYNEEQYINEYLDYGFVQQEQEEDDGCMIVVFMSLIFAFCTSLGGTILIYVSYLDDMMLKRYQEEAYVVRADVCSAEFARRTKGGGEVNGRDNYNCGSDGSGNVEYTATIEYDQIIADCYKIRIRKQIKVLETDFIFPDCPISGTRKDEEQKRIRDIESPPPQSQQHQQQPPPPPSSQKDKIKQSKSNPKVIINQDSFFASILLEHKKLDVLVLSGKPLSGYPKKGLERRLNVFQRMSYLISVLVFTLSLTGFCVGVAVYSATVNAKNQHETTVALIIIGVFGVIMMLEFPIAQRIIRDPINQMLEEDYFEVADITRPYGRDDSSLSTSSGLFISGSIVCENNSLKSNRSKLSSLLHKSTSFRSETPELSRPYHKSTSYVSISSMISNPDE